MKNHLTIFILWLTIFATIKSLTPIGLSPIEPYQLAQGWTTSYVFSYIPDYAVSANAVLKVKFPGEFDYTILASNLSCMQKTDSTNWTSVGCTFDSSNEVVISLGSITVQNNYAVIGSPKNPTKTNMSSFFSLCLGYNDVTTECNQNFGKIIFAPPPLQTTGTALTPSVTSLTSSVVGQSGTYQFLFSLTNTYTTGNSIRITFPVGFTTTTPVCQMNGTYNQIITTAVLPNSRSIECLNINKTLGTGQVLKIIGVYNPSFASTFGANSSGFGYFQLQVLSGTTNIVLEDILIMQSITINPGLIQANVTPTNYFIKSTNIYSFYINLLNPLSSQNYIRLMFPNSWTLYSGNCSALTGITLGTSGLSCTATSDSTYSYLYIQNFISASPNAQILLQTLLTTPPIVNNYAIEISTWNSQGKIDSVMTSIQLNSTYGTVNMLSVNAITASAKLPVGSSGPLQMTFFLNYQLPQTNVLTNGKLDVRIYPAIPAPSVATNGVIKCYFFNTIPSQNCTWTNMGTYTQLYVYTPLTNFYQYSQIPITITTEGASSVSNIGITIASIVQRYLFQIAFYQQISSTIPTQVFYTEFVANAPTIPTITGKSYTNEVNQWTHIRITMTAPYSFTDSTKDFRFRIQFHSTGAWASALGYSANTLYQNIPCMLSGYAVSASPYTKCDLYTFTSGPYVSNTVTYPGPYIIMYGFTQSIYAGYSYQLDFPKILISSVTGVQGNVRFSVIQQTPGMLNPYIELYYSQLTLFTTQTQSYNSYSTITISSPLSNSTINAMASYTFSWTVGATSDGIIYQFDKNSVPSFSPANQQCTISGPYYDMCVFQGYPAQWIIQTPSTNASIQSSVNSNIPVNYISNGIYSGTFTFYARSFTAGKVQKKVQFSVTYTPNAITSYSFVLDGVESSAAIYKGVEQYYDINFKPVTSLPVNCFIRYVFSNNIAPGALPYCYTTTLPSYNPTGVQCIIESSTTLKVYNLGALTAGTTYSVRVRLANTQSSTTSITGKVSISTYYSLSVDTSIVDQINSVSCSTYTNLYNSPNYFQMNTPDISLSEQRVGYIGKFQMAFIPSSSATITSSTSLVLSLFVHPWNTGYWSTPSSNNNDPIVCMITYTRVPCTYSYTVSSVLAVTLQLSSVSLSSSSQNIITLDTEYLSPYNGIVYPSYAGFYRTDLTFLNAGGTTVQAKTYHTRILPNKFQNLYINSYCNDIAAQNMFQVQFTTLSTSYPPAYTDATAYSRITIQFPTVDSQGNSVFASNLGGYVNTGDYVGCSFVTSTGYVSYSVNPLRCRLIKSQVSGDPAVVQIINHAAFSASTPSMSVYIAKIFNPSITTTSVNISVCIQKVTVATNLITQLYNQTFTLFLNTQSNAPAADVNQYNSTTSQFFQVSNDVGNLGYIYVYPQNFGAAISSTTGFWYVIQLDSTFSIPNSQNGSGQTAFTKCDSNQLLCLTFPEINYIVINSKTNISQVFPNVNFPNSISQVTTYFYNLVWQNYRYVGRVITTLSTTKWNQIRGAISSVNVGVVGSGYKACLARRQTEIYVSFVTANIVPSSGSIQIKFPTTLTNIYPNCRSAITASSGLYSVSGSYSGQIGCSIQYTNSAYSWVITGFQTLAAGTTVKIYGKIDMPTTAALGWLGTGQVITYTNTDSSNIRNNGKIVDYLNPTFNMAVYNTTTSFNVNSEVTMYETLPLRASYTGPFQFKFQLASSFVSTGSSTMRVRLYQTSVIGNVGGFVYQNTRKKVCQIIDTTTNEQLGCIVMSVLNDSTTSHNSILYTIASSTTLLSTKVYQMVITTQTGTPTQGIYFPTVAGIYKIDFNFDLDGSGNYATHNQMYLEIYGTTFNSLKVTSYVTIPSNPNLIWISLTPGTLIGLNDQIVIQIPTVAIDGTLLFANDLGTGYSDNQWYPVDILSGQTTPFMTCRLISGDQTNSKSAKIICGGFSTTITTAATLTFAFKVTNPAISTIAAIPIIIYTRDISNMIKTNYRLVESAINIRNSGEAITSNSALISSQNGRMQTSGGYLQIASRNSATLNVGNAYLVFFGFPLRTNGKITNGCTYNTGTIIGDIYYHYYNWVAVCVVTTNTLSTNNYIRFSSFYTPWYQISGSEAVVTAYSTFFDLGYTTKVAYTDTYPNQSPKYPLSSPITFTMTPVTQTTLYSSIRDDYTFDIVFGTGSDSNIDLSYIQQIAIVFPSNVDYSIVNTDCVEGSNSQIQIQDCYIDSTNRIIWITPVAAATYTSYTNSMKIEIVTKGLAIRNPINNQTNANLNLFQVKYYSWINITKPTLTPTSNNNYVYMLLDSNYISSTPITYNDFYVYPYTIPPFSYASIPQQRYYRQTPWNTVTHRAPFQFEFTTYTAFPATSGTNYNYIIVKYPSSFIAASALKINDLNYYKPVCYLANNRIKNCVLNTANQSMTLGFQFALATSTVYHVSFSILDPRNTDTNGFLYAPSTIVGATNLKIYTTPYGSSTSYLQTDIFPVYYSLPSGISNGPFRGIKSGSIVYGNPTVTYLNVISMLLTFNRTDITGLVFQIPLVDESGNQLFVSNSLTAFFSLTDGSPYPCGNNGYSAGGSVKCFIYNGDNTNAGVPTRIIMTDFTYVSQMNCRIVFNNPDTSGLWFSIKVKAYGGTRSATNLYGNLYMGYWNFMNVFQTITVASTSISSNTYTNTGAGPSQSVWRNNTSHYWYGSSTISAGQMSIGVAYLYNSGWSQTDKTFCSATLGSSANDDDLLILNYVGASSSYSTAYFIRKWTSSQNINSSPWTVSYLKCKHYINSFIMYNFYSNTNMQIATQQYTALAFSGVYSSSISGTPSTRFMQQDYMNTISTTHNFQVEVDITALISSVTNFAPVNGESYYFSFTYYNIWWSSVTGCRVGGGFTNSKNTPLSCSYTSDSVFVISGFDGFETDPILNSSSNYRIRFHFMANNIVSGSAPSTYVVTTMWANGDAYSGGLDPIFQKTGNTWYPGINDPNGYYNSSATQTGSSTFSIQAISNNYFQVVFTPSSNLGFGSSTYYHFYFLLNYFGFSIGTSCTITNLIIELSTSPTPGSGTNNTVPPTSMACSQYNLYFRWDSSSIKWANIFGGVGVGSTGWFNTSHYLIAYITFAPSNQQYPIQHRDWVQLNGLFAYAVDGSSWNNNILQSAVYNTATTPSLASSTTISTLSNNRGGLTELYFYLGSLATTIGSSNTNKILLLEFVSTSSWVGTSDPFGSYTVTSTLNYQIQCQCYSGAGPLTLSATTAFATATCYRRLPQTNFTNYAITVDYSATTGQDITCYFPQFKVTAGMNFQVQFKTVYGRSSYPNFPTGAVGTSYGGYFKSLSNNLTFTTSTPDMSATYVTSFTPTQSPSLFSSSVAIGTTTTLSSYTLSLPIGTLNQPYVYLNLNSGGPIASTSFCLNSNIFLECRSYTQFNNVIVARLKSTSISTITFNATTINYPKSQYSDSTTYGVTAYVSSSGQYVYSGTLSRSMSSLLPLTPTFTINNDLYGTNRASYKTNLILAFSVSNQTLYNNYGTGSNIFISFSGIVSYSTSCVATVQNQPNQVLTCTVGTNSITITSTYNYLTTNTIYVAFGITNPSSSVTFNLYMYSQYISSSRYWLAISQTATYAIDLTDIALSQLPRSRVNMYPFSAQVSTVANAPLRFRFNLPSGQTLSQSSGAQIVITNSQFAYTTIYQCIFHRYASLLTMQQRTQRYTYYGSYSISGSTLTVYPPKIVSLSYSYYYELIIMPIGINTAGCATSGACVTQTGFMNYINLDPISITAQSTAASTSALAFSLQNLFIYEGTYMIGLNSIYLLSTQPGTTSLWISFTLNFTDALNFPSHYVEIIFYDIDFTAFSGYSIGDTLLCQLGTMWSQVSGRSPPRCVINYYDYGTNIIKVRIQNFGPIVSGTYTISIDDFTLPTLSLSENSKKFDIAIGYYNSATSTKYQNLFRQIFVIDGTNITSATTPSVVFATPSPTNYGSSVTSILSLNWPFDSTTTGIQTKLVLQFKGGYSQTWSSITSLSLSDASNSYILLWYNSNLNKLIYQLAPNTYNLAVALSVVGMNNPYPYQQSLYNSINTVSVTFYYNYYLNSYKSISQPVWSTFTQNTPLVFINQNLPTNTFDPYVSSGVVNKLSPTASAYLILNVELDQTLANIQLRQLDQLQVVFTSGLTSIQSCFVIRNNTQYVNPLTSCQVKYSTYWKLEIYGVTESQFNSSVGWVIRIKCQPNAASLTYTFNLYSKNGLVEYTGTYSPSIANYYNSTMSIPTYLDFTHRKYVKGYYENQVRYVQALPSASTPIFKIRLTNPRTVSYSSDYLRIYLPTNVASDPFQNTVSNSLMICNFLPAMTAYNQFTVGTYAPCYKDTSTNPYSMYIYAPYNNLAAGADYLLIIRQNDPIATSWRYPSTSSRYEFLMKHYMSGVGTYYDSFIIDSYPLFRSMSVQHTTTTVGDYDTITIKLTPYGNAAAGGSTSSDLALRFSMSGLYYTSDAGINAIWNADNYGNFLNGYKYSQWLSNANASAATSVFFSQYSSYYSPVVFSLSLQSAYVDNTAYIWKIPIVTNPVTNMAGLRYNLTLMSYTSGNYYGSIISFYQSIHEYYTTTNTSTVLGTSLTSASYQIQSSSVSLSLNLNSYSLAQWQAVTFKLDNSLVGLTAIPDLIAGGNDTTNYNYYYFPTVNLIMAEKKSTNSITTVGLGSTESSQNYVTSFNFQWVRVCSTSNTQLTTNPFTLYSNTPAALTLTSFTTYSSSSVTLVQGLQSVGSNNLYKLTFTVPIVPQNGEIDIILNPSYFTFPSTKVGAHCLVNTNFVRSSNANQVLRCYQSSTSPYGYIITGFNQIATSTSVSVYIYTNVVAAGSNLAFTVNIYGIPGSYSTVINTGTIGSVTLAASTYPSTIYTYTKSYNPYYGSTHANYYYQPISGTFNLRSYALVGGDTISIVCPWSKDSSTVPRLLVKQNISTAMQWIQTTYTSTSGSTYVFTIPSTSLINFGVPTNTEYIFKLQGYFGTTSNGFYTVSNINGPQRFWFQTYSTSGSTYKQLNYVDFQTTPIPSSLVIDNRYRAAGKQTVLKFTFTINVDAYSGDQLSLSFSSNSLLYNMFPTDVEGVPDSVGYRYLECQQLGTTVIMSNTHTTCLLYYGSASASPPTPARLSIILGNNILGNTSTQTISFMVANVQNPATVSMAAGVTLQLLRTCSSSQNQKCPLTTSTGYYYTTAVSETVISTATTFTTSNANLLKTGVTHTFTLTLTSSVATTDAIYVVYPENYNNVMTSSCTVAGHTCYAFPTRNWIIIYPGSTINSGSWTLAIQGMTNGYYVQPASLYIKLTVARTGTTASVYYITQTPLTTLQASPTTSAASSLTITPTQTPNIFLRNYANTVTMSITNIYVSQYIQAFYVLAPTDVLNWDSTYCNATLSVPVASRTPYPLRFSCGVFNTSYIQILVTSDFSSYSTAWQDYTILLNAKFTLNNFGTTPVLYTTPASTSGLFYAYGSVSTTSSSSIYYMSQCQTTISISQYQVPIISVVTFDTVSFYYRTAQINTPQTFYLLLKPTTATPVSYIIFYIPREFSYPPVSNHDNCQMIGRTAVLISSCVQTRQNGQTLITIQTPSYDNSVKIIQLANSNSSNWFTAPSLPGSFYNFTVEMYSANNVLLQKQTVNISSVIGPSLNILNMALANTADQLSPGIFDFTFQIGSTQVPPGYLTSSTSLSSQIQLIFQNNNGFQNDLGMGLANGTELGCVINAGLTVGYDRIKCLLYRGTSVTNKPMVVIINYALIAASTTIKLSISNITTLSAGSVNTVSVAVVIFYNNISSSAYLYVPTPLITTTANTLYSATSNYGFIPAFPNTGNNVVLLPTVLNIYVQPYTYVYPNTNGNYYVLKFTPNILIDPYNPITVTCAACNTVQVFYGSGIVRFTPSSVNYWWGGYNYVFNNFPTSAYALLNKTITLTLTTYTSYQADGVSTYTMNRTVQKCTLSTFGTISVSSLNGGQIGVTYIFSFQTNHKVPPNAAVSITIPSQYGNMMTNNVTCILSGGNITSTSAYCLISTANRADIYLNGTTLGTNTSYYVTLVGLQNPNMNVSTLYFYFTTYFDSNIYLQHIICQNAISPPNITVKAIRSCGLSVTGDYYNTGYNTSYAFLISCSDVIRANSILYITIPSAYASTNSLGNITCSSYESTTLISKVCTLSYINGSLTLSANLLSSSNQISLTLLTNLVNPANNTYLFSAIFLAQGTFYAQTPTSGYAVTIYNSTYVVGAATNVYLFNQPRGAGISSYYIFKIASITNLPNPSTVSINFPSNFNNEIGSNIQVGIITTNNANLFGSLNYLNIDSLLANTSTNLGVSLYSLPTFTIDSTNSILTITNLSSLLGNSSSGNWNYYIIKGVVNPSQYLYQNFTIIYSQGTSTTSIVDWYFSYPLIYQISAPPNYLSITSISASDYDLLYPAVYTITVAGTTGTNIVTNNSQLAIIIQIPEFYSDTLWANSNLTCKLSIVNVNSNCTRYNNQIIILNNFTTNANNFTITISTLLNPSSPTYCNTTDVNLLQNTFFQIKFMNILTNDILYETSPVINSNTCMTFSSIRAPISVQYPAYMAAGLIYNFTFSISKNTTSLKIFPYCSSIGVTFNPVPVSFSDYNVGTQIMQVYLRSDMSTGVYTINFTKYEASTSTYYRNILPITINVMRFNSTSAAAPTIKISTVSISTVGYPIVVPIVLSSSSSTQMILTMTIAQTYNQTITQYSPSFGNFSISPMIIVLPANTLTANFTVAYYNTTVPPGLTLQFTLSSLYPLIHVLSTPTMYLLFSRDPKYQDANPPLLMKVQPTNITSTYDIGKNVINIFVKNITNSTTQPQVTNITLVSVSSTAANFNVYTRDSYNIYYAVLENGYQAPNNVNALINMTVANALTAGNVTSVVNTNNIVNFQASISINNLQSTTGYNLYLVCQSLLGTSIINTFSFTTTALSLGVDMKLSLNAITSPLSIVNSLHLILGIPNSRIIVITSNGDLLDIQNAQPNNKNTLNYTYEIVIAPDPLNDILSPITLVTNFVNNSTSLGLLKQYLPAWDNTTNIIYHEIRAIQPRVRSLPTLSKINMYNVTLSMAFWQRAKVYAVLIQSLNSSPNTLTIANLNYSCVLVGTLSPALQQSAPTSKQIRNGMDNNNNILNIYKTFSGITNIFGNISIFFDDLKPGSSYALYVTAANILPYEPTMLYSNAQVMLVNFYTLYNPNIKNSTSSVQSKLPELKKFAPELAAALQEFLSSNSNKNKFNP